jgi:hypothetical protein
MKKEAAVEEEKVRRTADVCEPRVGVPVPRSNTWSTPIAYDGDALH